MEIIEGKQKLPYFELAGGSSCRGFELSRVNYIFYFLDISLTSSPVH